MILPRLLLLFAAPFLADASFCGRSGVPFSVEILPTGAPVLGCAQPSCVAYPDSPESDDSHFESDIDGQIDGFFRGGDRQTISRITSNKLHANCSGEFNALQCSRKNQWVGGIEYIDHPRQPLVLQCCSFAGLRFSQDVGVTTITAGEAVTGGEVIRDGRQISFDVIANIRKVVDPTDPHAVSYEVTVRRMNCLPDPPEMEVAYDDDVDSEVVHVLSKSDTGMPANREESIVEQTQQPEQPAAPVAPAETQTEKPRKPHKQQKHKKGKKARKHHTHEPLVEELPPQPAPSFPISPPLPMPASAESFASGTGIVGGGNAPPPFPGPPMPAAESGFGSGSGVMGGGSAPRTFPVAPRPRQRQQVPFPGEEEEEEEQGVQVEPQPRPHSHGAPIFNPLESALPEETAPPRPAPPPPPPPAPRPQPKPQLKQKKIQPHSRHYHVPSTSHSPIPVTPAVRTEAPTTQAPTTTRTEAPYTLAPLFPALPPFPALPQLPNPFFPMPAQTQPQTVAAAQPPPAPLPPAHPHAFGVAQAPLAPLPPPTPAPAPYNPFNWNPFNLPPHPHLQFAPLGNQAAAPPAPPPHHHDLFHLFGQAPAAPAPAPAPAPVQLPVTVQQAPSPPYTPSEPAPPPTLADLFKPPTFPNLLPTLQNFQQG